MMVAVALKATGCESNIIFPFKTLAVKHFEVIAIIISGFIIIALPDQSLIPRLSPASSRCLARDSCTIVRRASGINIDLSSAPTYNLADYLNGR